MGDDLQMQVILALGDQPVDYTEAGAGMEIAWRAASVRHCWLVRAVNDFNKSDQTIELCLDTARRNRLDLGVNTQRLSSLRSKAAENLRPALDPSKKVLAEQYPSEKELPLSSMTAISTSLRELDVASYEPANAVSRAIAAEKGRAAAFYISIFAIGSLLLLLAKLWDWRSGTGKGAARSFMEAEE